MERTHIGDLKEYIGKEVTIAGWVDVRRDHGKLIFIDLRDASGKVQMVALPNHKEAHVTANMVRSEWVIQVSGRINKRPEKMVNAHEPNGTIELEILSISILNEANTPPFDVQSDGKEIGEEHRLRYRYVDLRRSRLQKNIRNRAKILRFVREQFSEHGFVEIETPLLSATTPEGSRDYVVPSRIENGKFYSLPQSPQQYKQLLMTAGFEKYYQIARCFRDEDTRGDRQPEFTQLDMEMSFVGREDVMMLNEEIMIALVQMLYPEKRIQEVPFPRLTYKEAMEKYGSDKPDLRSDKNDPNLLAFCWIIDFPFFEKDEDSGGWTFSHNPFSAPKPEHMEHLLSKKDVAHILTTQYDLALNGAEVAGGSIRNHRPEALKAVFEIMGYSNERIEKSFGHMLAALASGTPPHGGIAWGFDRLVMILENEPNIRETIAFAKTGEGRDLLMGAPSEIEAARLRELGLKLDDTKKK